MGKQSSDFDEFEELELAKDFHQDRGGDRRGDLGRDQQDESQWYWQRLYPHWWDARRKTDRGAVAPPVMADSTNYAKRNPVYGDGNYENVDKERLKLEENRAQRKRWCIIAIIAVCIIIALAAVIIVVVYIVVTENNQDDRTDVVPMSGQLTRTDWAWNAVLADRDSRPFKERRDELCNDLKATYENEASDTDTGYAIQNCDVIKFSSGSVKCDFRFEAVRLPRRSDMETVQEYRKVLRAYAAAESDVTLPPSPLNVDYCIDDTPTDKPCDQFCLFREGTTVECGCADGFNRSGTTCHDIDECASNSTCEEECENWPGSYTCVCPGGYHLGADGSQCLDTDECAEDNGGCTNTCTNTEGSYNCSCDAGFMETADWKICDDIDECLSSPCGGWLCHNYPGSYNCSCPGGYQLQEDEHSCLDIDECAATPFPCNHNCENYPGGFDCSCNDSYALNSDGVQCLYFAVTLNPEGDAVTIVTVMRNVMEQEVLCIVDLGSENLTAAELEEITIKWYNHNGDEIAKESANRVYAGEYKYKDAPSTMLKLKKSATGEDQGVYRCEARYQNYRDSVDIQVYVRGCGDGMFMCTSGFCIPESSQCDLRNDCLDGSDEECALVCGADEFQCSSSPTECIPIAQECDGRCDCSNSLDEVKCNDECSDYVCDLGPADSGTACGTKCVNNSDACADECSEGEFRCPTGQCIPGEDQCDILAVNDCGDAIASDESTCTTCAKDYFKCTVGPCVHESLWCDGDTHCPDGSDETDGCLLECAPNQVSCDSTCLSGLRRCDGLQDCSDNSDETDCECPELQCDNGMCMHADRWCDGIMDCLDGTDEASCEAALTEPACAEGLHKCDERCVTGAWVCNGQPNCLDGSDEVDCVCNPARTGDVTPTKRFMAPCDTGMCIPAARWCDGRSQCPDGSDEVAGCSTGCPDDFHTCADGGCIPKLYLCDLVEDCADGSDEHSCTGDCVASDLYPGETIVHCADNAQCIPESYLCDGIAHCADKSDESVAQCCSGDSDNHKCDDDARCVPAARICDGVPDCEDWSDETNCSTVTCAFGKEKCSALSAVCLWGWQKCDGVQHCQARTDETSCGVCGDGLTACTGQDYCIPTQQVCDGKEDCQDGTDETGCGCPSGSYMCDNQCYTAYKVCTDSIAKCDYSRTAEPQCDCPDDRFSCAESVLCLNNNAWCNRNRECPTGGDEPDDCGENCKTGQLACDGRCLAPMFVCDGERHCSDWSDEEGCGDCAADKWQCVNTTICIDLKKRCDGKVDCPSGSDELQCPQSCAAGLYLCDGTCHTADEVCIKDIQNCDDVQTANCGSIISKTALDPCSHSRDVGLCDDVVEKWYYNALTKACQTFQYGGCGGNDNRFDSRELCEEQCTPPKCPSAYCQMSCRHGLIDGADGCKLCECYDPCKDTTCSETQTCEVRNVECVATPCRPVGICIDKCGMSNYQPSAQDFQSLTRGADVAVPHSWPWVGYLQYGPPGTYWHYQCDVTIINKDWVVTAAHCLHGAANNLAAFRVVTGQYDSAVAPPDSDIHTIGEIILHEDFNSDMSMQHDIALVKLEKSLTFSKTVWPVCLRGKTAESTSCTAVSWGFQHENLAEPSQLAQAPLPMMAREGCKRVYDYRFDVTADMLCGAVTHSGLKPCLGDTGSPLFCKSTDTYFLSGILVWGQDYCRESHRPAVFTDIGSYVTWIETQTGILL